jgi:hypothetical protein
LKEMTMEYPVSGKSPDVVNGTVPHGIDGNGNAVPAGRTTTTATIANGASLSGAVDLGGATMVAIQMPANWTAANLTFQLSADGVTYAELQDELGNTFTVTAAASLAIASAALAATFLGARYLKVRSGTSGVPINQGAARDIKIIAAF